MEQEEKRVNVSKIIPILIFPTSWQIWKILKLNAGWKSLNYILEKCVKMRTTAIETFTNCLHMTEFVKVPVIFLIICI